MMDEDRDVDKLSSLILQYMYEEKLKGRVELTERELFEVLGAPFEGEGDGRVFKLTTLGESKVVYLDDYKKKLH